MKRCPQCDFIYLDTDEVCDLDGVKLVQVADTELALNEATKANTRETRLKSRTLLAAVVGLLLSLALFVAYLFSARSHPETQAQTYIQPIQENSPTPVTVVVAPTPESSATPEPSPVIAPKTQQADQTKRIAISKAPVSTSTDQKATGQIWIKLSNGARIEADEVWRTRQGVWYRRNGVVTLIKADRVKAVEKAR